MTKFIVLFLVIVGLLVAGVFTFVKVLSKAGDDLSVSYMKPDTAITIHNGHPDTVITKKSKPFWLK